MTVADETVVHGLDVGGVEPDRGTGAGLGNGGEVGAGNDVAECEGDRPRVEDDGVRTSCSRTLETSLGYLLKEASSALRVLLQALERDGYVTRPAPAPVGKVLPT